jgi:hypothetical protein
MSRRLLTVILVSLSAAFMAACGSGNNDNGISIGFSQAPPAVLQTSTAIPVDAVVVNDTANKGVDWTVTCGSSDCGSFSPTHTDSGAATTYTGPATVPTGNTVTITATATASSSAVATGTVTITTGSTAGGLNGQYAFVITGFDANDANYFAAGSIIADGNGNITGGEEDFCDTVVLCSTAVLSGTYSTGGDGRGSINLTNTDANVGPQTLAIVVTSSSHALIIEFDGFATSSGTLDLQDPNALNAGAISGGYSFAMNGIDGNGFGVALGGIMTSDGAGGFTNVTLDENDGGQFSSGTTAFTANAPPDSFGRVVIQDPNVEFVYYIVSAKALRFVEVDQSLFLTSGSAYTQGTSSPNVGNLAGNSVFVEAGETPQSFLGLAGQFTADNGGDVSAGFMDVNDGGLLSNGSISGSTFGSFVNARGTLTLSGNVDSNVTDFQVYLVDPGVNILDPNNSTGGGGALLLDADSNAIAIGEIVPQASGAQFNGTYGLNIQAFSSSAENDLEGQLTATGSSSISGTGDLNNLFTLFAAQTLTGSFTADSNNPGRFTGSLTVGTFGTFNLVYYQASNSQLVLVEIDGAQVGTGTLVQQQ